MTKFVKRYPRALVRIARPRPGQNTWGPMWNVWILDHDGNVTRDAFGRPEQVTVSPRLAALDAARLDVGITRRLRGVTPAGAGDPR